jgi:hypothetical protein
VFDGITPILIKLENTAGWIHRIHELNVLICNWPLANVSMGQEFKYRLRDWLIWDFVVLPCPLSYVGMLCYMLLGSTAICCPHHYTTVISCKRSCCNLHRSFLSQDKSKVVPLHAMEVYGGVGPLILTFGTNWTWVISFTLRPLYFRGKSSRNLSNRNRGWSQSRCGCFGGSENPLISTGIK